MVGVAGVQSVHKTDIQTIKKHSCRPFQTVKRTRVIRPTGGYQASPVQLLVPAPALSKLHSEQLLRPVNDRLERSGKAEKIDRCRYNQCVRRAQLVKQLPKPILFVEDAHAAAIALSAAATGEIVVVISVERFQGIGIVQA